MSHFISDGASQYEQALEAEYRSKIEALEREISSAGDPQEGEALRRRIRALRKECKAKKRAIHRSLFQTP